ncbi:hypothetical protein COO60DRAFT_1482517 [Scenedesmus sp. NREL 46B-D3]|nr:hypothetical protein COO60DRAFT_1482517 [Scenedesmus sp. NREL 46B-D3]
MRSTTQLLAVLCLAVAALPAAAQAPASSSLQLPSTLAMQGPSRVCTCVAGTYDSKDCALRFKTAAGVSGFLAAMCMPASSSTQMDACLCFTAPASDACALARFKTCSLGEPLCAALTLGDAASEEQRTAGLEYRARSCQTTSTLEVELVFAGIDQDTYNTQFAGKTAAALANITGVPIERITFNSTTVLNVPPPPAEEAEEPAAAAAAKPAAASKPVAVAQEAAPAATLAAVPNQLASFTPKPVVAKAETSELPVVVKAETADLPVAVKAETAETAELPVVVKAETEADAEAEATAQAKDFDSWADAPSCSYPKTNTNFKSDRLGRAWGYNSATGESCAFKVAAGAPPPAYEEAPPCAYELTASNALPDKLGRLWGYDDATGQSCVFSGQSLAAPLAPAPAPTPAPAKPGELQPLLLQQFFL